MTIVIQRNSQRFLIVFQLNCCGKGQGTAFLTHITDTLGLTELCPSSGTYFVSVKMQQILLHEPQTLLLQEKPNFSSVNNSIFAAQTWRHRHRCHGIVQAGVILVVEVELELKGHTLLRPAQVESPFLVLLRQHFARQPHKCRDKVSEFCPERNSCVVCLPDSSVSVYCCGNRAPGIANTTKPSNIIIARA